MIDTGLKDRVVLITGANNPRGIGAATAHAFARQGAAVFITYLRLLPEASSLGPIESVDAVAPGRAFYHAMRAKTADEIVDLIHEMGGRAEACEADLRNAGLIPQLFDRVEKTFGTVDILVNNAAHYEELDTVFDVSAQGIDDTFAVNARASLLLISEFVRRRRQAGKRWGRVINLSTDAAQSFASQITYGSSKAAIEAFTRSVAIEVGHLEITVNSVAPGPVQTGWLSKDAEQEEARQIPLGRIGQPEDIADVVVFLASEQARWLTGQVIQVSGGHAL